MAQTGKCPRSWPTQTILTLPGIAGSAQFAHQRKQIQTLSRLYVLLLTTELESSLLLWWKVSTEYVKNFCTSSSYLIWNQSSLGNNQNKTKFLLNRGSLKPHTRHRSNREVCILRSYHKNTNNTKNLHSTSSPQIYQCCRNVLQKKLHIWTPENKIWKNHNLCWRIQV